MGVYVSMCMGLGEDMSVPEDCMSVVMAGV